jgi:hypothetical protein
VYGSQLHDRVTNHVTQPSQHNEYVHGDQNTVNTQYYNQGSCCFFLPSYLFILCVSCNFSDFSMLMFGLVSGEGIPPLSQQQPTAFATPLQWDGELPYWILEGEKLMSATNRVG